ncbi:MAG: hemin receptor [Actinomycetota bacterium]|nr:MAG: hemin receptor [Actinomycetota bacterium]
MLAGAAALVLAGCGLLASPPEPDNAAGGGARSAATGGPWTCAGPRTATTPADAVWPIGAAPSATLPVTVTDFSGRAVTVTDTRRILALDTYGTLATTVYALGLGDRLVGRDVSTGIPALAHLPVVTHNGHELNAEAILNLNPSVILTDYSIGPLEVQLQLRDAGIPVVILDGGRSRATIEPQIEAVAAALGVPAAGRALADRVTADVTAAEAEVARLAPAAEADRPRIVFLYLRGQAGVYYWFGKGSGADDLIAALDGVDVATQTGLLGERPITAEGLVKAAPDLYLMMSHGLESVGGVAGLGRIPGVGTTTAGRDGCVVDMADSQILSFGPQFPATLTALARAVYGGPPAATASPGASS